MNLSEIKSFWSRPKEQRRPERAGVSAVPTLETLSYECQRDWGLDVMAGLPSSLLMHALGSGLLLEPSGELHFLRALQL